MAVSKVTRRVGEALGVICLADVSGYLKILPTEVQMHLLRHTLRGGREIAHYCEYFGLGVCAAEVCAARACHDGAFSSIIFVTYE